MPAVLVLLLVGQPAEIPVEFVSPRPFHASARPETRQALFELIRGAPVAAAEAEDARLDEIYTELGKALDVPVHPGEWQGYLVMGLTRCEKALAVMEIADRMIREADEADRAWMREGKKKFLDLCARDAFRPFQGLARAKPGSDWIRFANAATRITMRKFEDAIRDLEHLSSAGRSCGDLLTFCHARLGAAAFVAGERALAERHVRAALRTATHPDDISRLWRLYLAVGRRSADRKEAADASRLPYRPTYWRTLVPAHRVGRRMALDLSFEAQRPRAGLKLRLEARGDTADVDAVATRVGAHWRIHLTAPAKPGAYALRVLSVDGRPALSGTMLFVAEKAEPEPALADAPDALVGAVLLRLGWKDTRKNRQRIGRHLAGVKGSLRERLDRLDATVQALRREGTREQR